MEKASMQLFLEALHEAEYSIDGPALRVQVKYRGEALIYEEWPPVRPEAITRTGLLDPGFGSGPINYRDIECLVVPSVSRLAPESNDYARKFARLVALVATIPGAEVRPDAITFESR